MKNAISMKNIEFKKMYKTNKSIANNLLILYTLKCDLNDKNKLGICASKTVGNSVIRHRATRLIREAYRTLEDDIKLNNSIVIVARKSILNCNEQEVQAALYNLLKRANLLISNDCQINESNK